MACTSVSGPLVSAIVYTEKQKNLIAECASVISQEGIELEVNPEAYMVQSPCAVDVEHDEQGNLVGIGVFDGQRAYYWTTPLVGGWIKQHALIMHNGVSDIECLRMWGINVRDEQLVHDTMLIGHLLDSSLKSYGLKDMSKRELNIVYPSYDEIVGKRGLKTPRVTLDKQPIELVSKYNACDTLVTYRLYERQKKAMEL